MGCFFPETRLFVVIPHIACAFFSVHMPVIKRERSAKPSIILVWGRQATPTFPSSLL
jgi:hypothetical protein